jgi:hypothetical protein
MFSEAGIDLNNKFENVNGRPPTRNDPMSQRQEMTGPKNIDSILSGLKPKTVNIQENRDSD